MSQFKSGLEFYILLAGETEEHTMWQSRHLGFINMRGNFITDDGFTVLKNIIKGDKIHLLSECKIIDSQKKTYTVDNFLKIVERLSKKNKIKT